MLLKIFVILTLDYYIFILIFKFKNLEAQETVSQNHEHEEKIKEIQEIKQNDDTISSEDSYEDKNKNRDKMETKIETPTASINYTQVKKEKKTKVCSIL